MICCVLGFCLDFLKQKVLFLDENKHNMVVFIDYERPQNFEFTHPNLYFFTVQSLLDISVVSAKIASLGLVLPIEVVELKKDSLLQQVAAKILSIHQHLNVEFSDVLDFGVQKYKNAIENLQKSYQKIQHLKDLFKNIPAIIVGAGPSLESTIADLEKYQSKALIIAGGKALEKIPFKPHFGVIIDPNELLANVTNLDTVICFQARVNSQNLARFSSNRLQIPEGHLPFLNELTGDDSIADCGVTCGNVGVYLSLVLGCNPIITCGMDFCFLDNRKYAFDESKVLQDSVTAVNQKGILVKTQNDWMLAVAWMQKVSKLNPDRKFFNISEEGLEFFPKTTFADLFFDLQEDFHYKIQKILQKVPYNCLEEASRFQTDFSSEKKQTVNIEEKLLIPLWNLWSPIFEREFVKNGSNSDEEMQKHKLAFFDMVLNEYRQL